MQVVLLGTTPVLPTGHSFEVAAGPPLPGATSRCYRVVLPPTFAPNGLPPAKPMLTPGAAEGLDGGEGGGEPRAGCAVSAAADSPVTDVRSPLVSRADSHATPTAEPRIAFTWRPRGYPPVNRDKENVRYDRSPYSPAVETGPPSQNPCKNARR